MTPKGLSIVTPVYQSEGTLLRTLESVSESWQGLGQKVFIPTEHVVVLDGPDNECQTILRGFARSTPISIKVIEKLHSGIAASRNRGVEAASYSHVTFLDADDEMTGERLNAAVGYPDHAIIGMQRVIYDNPTRPPAGVPAGLLDVQKKSPYLTSMVLPRTHVLELGGFREDLALSDDLDLVIRLRKKGVTIKLVDEVFVIRHVTGRNASLDYASLRRELFDILRASRDIQST